MHVRRHPGDRVRFGGTNLELLVGDGLIGLSMDLLVGDGFVGLAVDLLSGYGFLQSAAWCHHPDQLTATHPTRVENIHRFHGL